MQKKRRKRMSGILLQFFWKNCSRSSSNSCLLFSSYLVCFEWFKIWWVIQLWLYKTSLNFRGKDETIKDFKFKILNLFSFTHHWALKPLHPTPHIFTFLLPNWIIFVALEALGGGFQMFYELYKQMNNVWAFNLLWVFKCSLTRLSILVWKVFN
jgi:hypothetical protein